MAVGGYYVYLVMSGRIPNIIKYEGLAGLFVWLVIIPFGYAPILIETASIYISLNFSLPRRFDRESVEINYFDPYNLGGLRPIGELLKHTFYLFMFGVVLITILLYAPFVFPERLYTPYQPPERFITVAVLGLWGLGVFSMGYSLYTVHKYMRSRRREELRSLESRLHEIVSDPYDLRQAFDYNEDIQEFEREKYRIEQVRDTKEFPATTAMWLQIIISGVIPLAIQWIIRWLNNIL